MDWVITVPKSVAWTEYEKEIAQVADGTQVMNYRVPHVPKDMQVGDRCFVTHDGKVRGWMRIVGLAHRDGPWQCTTTGREWPAGHYIQRGGPFHAVDGPAMKGFRGVRRYDHGATRVATRWFGE